MRSGVATESSWFHLDLRTGELVEIVHHFSVTSTELKNKRNPSIIVRQIRYLKQTIDPDITSQK